MVDVIQDVLPPGLYLGTNGDDTFSGTDGGLVEAFFWTKGGNDTVSGFDSANNVDGEGIPPSQGIAIFDGIIATSTGEDLVEAIATGDNSIGILGTAIDTGADDDIVRARGQLVGVTEVKISTSEGDDLIDIQSGDGILDGGPGTDTLALEGTSEDYLFLTLDPARSAGIIESFALGGDSSPLTQLAFDSIELFEFEGQPDMTFTYGQLFTPVV